MKCPDAQSSHLWRSGGCCWIMKVFKRLAQGSMARLCARTGDPLFEALSWLLSVPHGRDHWRSSICFIWAGCSSLTCVTPKATKYAAWLLSRLLISFAWGGVLESQAAGMGQRHCKSWGAGQWPEDTVLSTGPCSACPRFSAWTCLRGGAQCPSMLQLCWREAQHPHDGPWSETHNFPQS